MYVHLIKAHRLVSISANILFLLSCIFNTSTQWKPTVGSQWIHLYRTGIYGHGSSMYIDCFAAGGVSTRILRPYWTRSSPKAPPTSPKTLPVAQTRTRPSHPRPLERKGRYTRAVSQHRIVCIMCDIPLR